MHRGSLGYKRKLPHKEYIHRGLLGNYLVFTSSGIYLLDLSPYGGSILGLLPSGPFVRASKLSRTGPRVNPESIPPTLAPKRGLNFIIFLDLECLGRAFSCFATYNCSWRLKNAT